MTGSLDPCPDLELRARPRPIRRLNKRALLIGAGLVVLVIAGAIIIALNPPRLTAREKSPELYNTERKKTAEGLAKLSRSYAEIPQLGPPAPGDIDRALVQGDKRPGSASSRPSPCGRAGRSESSSPRTSFSSPIARRMRGGGNEEGEACKTARPRTGEDAGHAAATRTAFSAGRHR